MMEVEVNNKRVFAATGGRIFDAKNNAVIFIHGAAMDHTVWSLQTRWFAWNGWSVLALDLPGHGKSEGPAIETIDEMVEWLRKFIEVSGSKHVSLVGHSMGAFIALESGALFPDKICSIALLGIAPRMRVHPQLLSAACENDPLASELIVSWGFGRPSHFGANRSPGLWMQGGGRALLSKAPKNVLGIDLAACDSHEGALSAAEKLSCPTLILCGDCDQMTTPKAANALGQTVKDVNIITLQNCGHMMSIEKPDETLTALINFL